MAEFELIQRHFSGLGVQRSDVLLGIGDDCALLQPPKEALAVSLDCFNEGIHFPVGTAPFDIGYKALAVNLSDLAAMGAQPLWFMLGLSLPAANPAWIADFSAGLSALATRYSVALVGGDTTRGPLSISIQIQGSVPPSQALRRLGARPGDGIWVSGSLGDAAAGLRIALASLAVTGPDADYLLQRLNRPSPRIELGLALRGRASAAIDISDGLLADLGHILQASGCGARLQQERLPLSAPLLRSVPVATAIQSALTGGDDYELCFCLPEVHTDWLQQQGFECYRIGQICPEPGIQLLADGQSVMLPTQSGYEHFRA